MTGVKVLVPPPERIRRAKLQQKSGDRLHQATPGGGVIVVVVAGVGLEQGKTSEAQYPQEDRQHQRVRGGAGNVDQLTHVAT